MMEGLGNLQGCTGASVWSHRLCDATENQRNLQCDANPGTADLLKSKKVWNPKAGGKKAGVAQAGRVGEELTGFYFLNPTLLSWTPWVPGRPLLPPL